MKSKIILLRVSFWIIFLVFSAITVYLMTGRNIGTARVGIYQPKTAYEYYRLGKKLLAQREFRQAKNALEQAIKLDDRLGKAYLELAALYVNTIHYDLALEYTLKALELVKDKDKANEEVVYYNLGHIYQTRNEPVKAWENFCKAYGMKSTLGKDFWRDDPNNYVYYVIHNDREGFINAVLKSGELPEKKLLPRYVWQWQEDFMGLYRERNYDEIIKKGEYFIEDHPTGEYNYIASKWLANSYFEKKRYSDMFRHLQLLDAADLNYEECAWKNFLYYYFYKADKQYDRAFKYLDVVIKDYNGYSNIKDVYYAKVNLLKEAGDINAEREFLKQIVQQFPDSWLEKYANRRLLTIELYAGNYSESYRYLLKTGFNKPIYIFAFIFGVIGCSGFSVLFLFLIMCVFYNQKRQALKYTAYRFRHFFGYEVLHQGCFYALLFIMLIYNHYMNDVFAYFNFNVTLAALIITNILVVLYVLHFLHNVYKLDYKTLGFKFSGLKIDLLLPLLVIFGLIIIYIGYGLILKYFHIVSAKSEVMEIIDIIASQGNITDKVAFLLNLTFFAAVTEEIIFRMFMINYIEKFTSLRFAVIYSSFIFAIGHMDIQKLPILFILGFLLATVYLKTKSIIPGIVIHSINNLLLVFIFTISR